MRFSHLSDEELIAKYRQGSTDHLEALMCRYDSICRFEARDSIQRLNDEDTRTGECRLALIRALESFDQNSGVKFKSYAKFCMRNALKDMARKEQRRPEEVVIDPTGDDDEPAIERLFSSESDVLEDASAMFLLDQIEAAINGLPEILVRRIEGQLNKPSQGSLFDSDESAGPMTAQEFGRSVIELRVEGATLSEVADHHGVSIAIVKIVLHWISSSLYLDLDLAEEEHDTPSMSLEKHETDGLFEAA